MPFNVERATALRVDIDQAECTDAFAARLGRLQDTVADELLPEFLRCLAKPVGAAIDNLDRAEKLGLLDSADDWLASRKLRNRMVRRVHGYVRDADEWADVLNRGHAMVTTLVAFAQAVLADCRRRGLLAG